MARPGHANAGPWAGVFLFLIISISFLALPAPARAATATVSLQMLGEAPLFDGTTPILVAGIWHQVTVNLSDAPATAVVVSAVLPGASPQGMANTYRWTYDPSSGSWSDPLYGAFVRPDLSSASGSQVVFVAGVDAQATPGTWTLAVTEGTATLASLTIETRTPSVSAGLSVADFVFQVDPFTSVDVSSQVDGQYLRLVNDGNVPLGLNVSFDVLRSNLSLANPAAVAHVGSDAKFYLHLSMGPQPPQIVLVNGVSDVVVRNVIPSPGASTIVPAIEQPFSLSVRVGHSGYALKVVGNVVFQTIDTLAANYGSVATWDVYLTGSQDVSLGVTVSGARLVGIFEGSQPLTLPAILTPSTTSELAVTIQVEPTNPSGGSVIFTLTLLATGDSQTFTTSLAVQGGPAPPSAAVSLLWIAGAALAAGVFLFVALMEVRHRRQVGREAAEEEASRKKGYHARKAAHMEQRRRSANGKGAKGKGHGKGDADAAGKARRNGQTR